MQSDLTTSGWSDRTQPLILVVDDDEVAQFLYRQALEREGFCVVGACNGEHALTIFQDRRPDLVLLDVVMPGMDGFEVCAAMRHLPMGIGAHIPILIVTGLDDVGSIERAYVAGATDFTTKPINWMILLQRLRYMLRASQSFRRLGESERRLAQAQKIAALGSWEWDIRTGAIMWSREMFSLLGYPPVEEIDPPVAPCLSAMLAHIHPDDRERLQAAAEQIGAGISPEEEGEDFRIIGPGDIVRIVRFTGRPERDALGEIVRVVGVAQDITERCRSEDVLRQALGQAEAANRAKSEFLATMSHELRTPMNAILGFTEIMDRKLYGPIGNDQYESYVRLIHESGEHLLHLINAILDLSKAEQGMIELHDDPVDVTRVAHACRRLLQAQADTKQIVFDLDLPEQPLPALLADEMRVWQILLNILSNALKFTPEHGKVTLRVRRDAGDAGLAFEVADTGIGMRTEDIPIALAKFGQIDSSHSRRYEGTGLGLPLTKRLIELHGGTLEILSAPGEGTTVIVTFPPARILDRTLPATAAE